MLGFTLGRLTAPRHTSLALPVPTAVALPPEETRGAQFMASGWIEVPTPRYPLAVGARVTERLAALYVHEGQVVTSGMIVARLYDADLRKQCEAARAAFLAASNRAARIERGFRSEDVAAALASLQEAEERLRISSTRFERVRAMLRADVVSTDEYDTALSAFRQAEATYAFALAQWQKRSAGYRAEEVAQARAEAAAAEAAWHLAERAVEYCTVRVPPHPRPLRVLSVRRTVGDWITAGDDGDPTIVTLYDPTDLHVRVDVNQANISSVYPGMPVLITTEAASRRRYRGTVARIEPRANLAKNTITVRVALTDPDEWLFPDMLCQVTFLEQPGPSRPTAPASVLGCADAACASTTCQPAPRRARHDHASEQSCTSSPAPQLVSPCKDTTCSDALCTDKLPMENACSDSECSSTHQHEHSSTTGAPVSPASRTPPTLLIPETSLVATNSTWYVWVVEDGRATLRPVALGERQGAFVSVQHGLRAGQRVILQPPLHLAPGQPVDPR